MGPSQPKWGRAQSFETAWNSSQGTLSYGADTSHCPPPNTAAQRKWSFNVGFSGDDWIEETEALWNLTPAPLLTELSLRHPVHALASVCPSDVHFPFSSFCLPLWTGLERGPVASFLLPMSSPVILLTDETSLSALELLPPGPLSAPELQLSSFSAIKGWGNFKRHIYVDVSPGSTC